MRSIPKNDFRELTPDESMKIGGGDRSAGLIYTPHIIGQKLGAKLAPHIVEYYVRYSLMINY